jgi:hypothetical protein
MCNANHRWLALSFLEFVIFVSLQRPLRPAAPQFKLPALPSEE